MDGAWRRELGALLLVLGAALCMVGYDAAGRAYYAGYRVPQGVGMDHLLPEELTQLAMFTLFGGAATVLLWAALRRLPLTERATDWVRAQAGWPAAIVVAVVLSGGIVLVRSEVLRQQVVTDDEHTYAFIAQTLRTGALVAPSPGTDLEFFREQFVVLDGTRRFGKYPIGHPLALIAADAIGLRRAFGAACAALAVLAVFDAGKRLLGRPAGFLAALLLATSPAVMLNGATTLSQTTTMLCAAVGLAAMARVAGSASGTAAIVAGLSFGLATLARPLPGGLLVLVVLAWLAWQRAGWRPGLAFAVPAFLLSSVVLATNWIQSGHPLTTGYHVFHGVPGGTGGVVTVLVAGTAASLATSLSGGLLRLNSWLFGTPFSLAPLAGAPRAGSFPVLCWGMVVASIAYRVVSPKVGVGITGPQYFMEAVPALCLLSAAALSGPEAMARLGGRAGVGAAMIAAFLVNVTMFLPPKLRDVRLAAEAQEQPSRLIARAGLPSGSLVFHRMVVAPALQLTWAYYPRPNAPGLDDDILFMWLPVHPDALQVAREMKARRFPDRAAFVLDLSTPEPRLVPFADYVDPLSYGRP